MFYKNYIELKNYWCMEKCVMVTNLHALSVAISPQYFFIDWLFAILQNRHPIIVSSTKKSYLNLSEY